MPENTFLLSQAQALKLKAYVKLMRATETLTRATHPSLETFGLTLTQFGVLEALFHLGPLCQKEIGQKILKSGGNITQTVDILEQRGLACRKQDPDDRRFTEVELTGQGHHLMASVFPLHAARVEKAFASLSMDEVMELGRLLKKLGTHID